MTKIFLDSNIWLRFFLRDNNQFVSVKTLLSFIEGGKFLPYASAIVLMEIAFVLEKAYGLSRAKISENLETVTKTRNITILNKTDHQKAINYFRNYNIKFNDCLIASQIPKEMVLVTFDKEFSKIQNLLVKTPGDLLS